MLYVICVYPDITTDATIYGGHVPVDMNPRSQRSHEVDTLSD